MIRQNWQDFRLKQLREMLSLLILEKEIKKKEKRKRVKKAKKLQPKHKRKSHLSNLLATTWTSTSLKCLKDNLTQSHLQLGGSDLDTTPMPQESHQLKKLLTTPTTDL